jgi:hypothetical protein
MFIRQQIPHVVTGVPKHEVEEIRLTKERVIRIFVIDIEHLIQSKDVRVSLQDRAQGVCPAPLSGQKNDKVGVIHGRHSMLIGVG